MRHLSTWLADERGEIELQKQSWASAGWLVFVLITVSLVAFVWQYYKAQTSHQNMQATAGALSDQLDSQAHTAMSVRVPPLDVFGKANTGQFIGFFKDVTCTTTAPCGVKGVGQDLFWGYEWNSTADTLQKYTWRWDGTAFTNPVADGAAIPNVTSMTAVEVKATQRVNPNSPYFDPVLRPLNGVVKDISCSYGFTDYPGTNSTVEYTIKFGPNGRDGVAYGRLFPETIYCDQQINYTGYYTPPPMGPLHTLGKIEFSAQALADAKAPIDVRVAQLVNNALGGGVASAGGVTCSYARLWYADGTVDHDAPNNPAGLPEIDNQYPDTWNTTDANGCVTDGKVRLWAAEQNYTGIFDAQGVCAAYIKIGALSWTASKSTGITANASTAGCQFPVEDSGNNTVANGKAPYVIAIVDADTFELVDGFLGASGVVNVKDVVAEYTKAFTQNPPCHDNAAPDCWTIYVMVYDGTHCPTKVSCTGVAAGDIMVFYLATTVEMGGTCISPSGCTHLLGGLLASGKYVQIGIDEMTNAQVGIYYVDAANDTLKPKNWCMTVAGSVSPDHCDAYESYTLTGRVYPTPLPSPYPY